MKDRAGSAGETFAASAIEAAGLTKRYREVTAVDSLELVVKPGEIYGFLGRNGAGKTTTIRMILGLIRPDEGRVSLFGSDVAGARKEAVAQVGCLVETATAYPNLTVRENLELQRDLTCSPPSAVKHAMERLGLEELAGRRAGRLSLGNRQRLAVARALLPQPKLLVLDEPANALDPAGIVEIRKMLRRLADEEGTTIFISSHILAEIVQLADRIGIIHRGRLVDEFDCRDPAPAGHRIEVRAFDPERTAAALERDPSVGTVTRAADGAIVLDGDGIAATRIARALLEADINFESIRPLQETLEDRFLKLTGGGP